MKINKPRPILKNPLRFVVEKDVVDSWPLGPRGRDPVVGPGVLRLWGELLYVPVVARYVQGEDESRGEGTSPVRKSCRSIPRVAVELPSSLLPSKVHPTDRPPQQTDPFPGAGMRNHFPRGQGIDRSIRIEIYSFANISIPHIRQ